MKQSRAKCTLFSLRRFSHSVVLVHTTWRHIATGCFSPVNLGVLPLTNCHVSLRNTAFLPVAQHYCWNGFKLNAAHQPVWADVLQLPMCLGSAVSCVTGRQQSERGRRRLRVNVLTALLACKMTHLEHHTHKPRILYCAHLCTQLRHAHTQTSCVPMSKFRLIYSPRWYVGPILVE